MKNSSLFKWNSFALAKHLRACIFALVILGLVVSAVLAADGVLTPQANSPFQGHYCFEAVGVALGSESQAETIDVNVNGTPIAAYFYWSSRYAGEQSGDTDLFVAINGGSPATITAEEQEVVYASYSDRFYYTYRSADLVTTNAGLNLAAQTTPFSLTISGLRGDEAHGAGIVVVYENDALCSFGEVHLNFGIDSFHHRFSGVAGPHSEVNCITFEPVNRPRPIDYQMFVGGIEGPPRPNSIWTKTGVGPLPDNYALVDIIDDPDAAELANPLDGDEGNVLGEWDNHQAQFNVPANHDYACVQIESVPDLAPEHFGTSGVLVNLVYKVEVDEPTPTATATATNTPTEVPPTPTPSPTATDTPTEVPPTPTPSPTPTDTPTEVPPTPTPSPTPTDTPTEMPPTPTPSPTATDTPTSTPTPTVQVQPTVVVTNTVIKTPEVATPTATPTPTPEPPLCTSDTDLQLIQAVETEDHEVTITLSYWNQSSIDLDDIHLIDVLPDFTSLNPSRDNSAWQCSEGTCRISVGTLPANGSSSSANQVQLHLIIEDGFPTGQTTTINTATVFQEAEGLQGAAICTTQESATIKLPTALEIGEEPESFMATDFIYLPVGNW